MEVPAVSAITASRPATFGTDIAAAGFWLGAKASEVTVVPMKNGRSKGVTRGVRSLV